MEINYLTPKELALKLKVSQSLIYGMVKNGELPHIRIRTSIRFNWNEITEFLKENQCVPKNNNSTFLSRVESHVRKEF